MTNHSSLIRKLRKERGLIQEQLTRGISQRRTLAAFESRGTKISFELLVNYLERMNITLREINPPIPPPNKLTKIKLFSGTRQPPFFA